MKKSKGISLVLSPVLGAMMLTACGDEPAARDVYQSKDECAKDWGSDLCEQMNDSDAQEYRSNHGHSGVYFWGPMYYGRNRSVMYQGRTITPAGKSSTLASYSVTSRSSAASRTGKSSPASVTTGGFGGRSGSSSSSS